MPFIEIGVIARPHGIHGEIRVNYYAESTEMLRGALFLQAGSQPPRPVAVRQLRVQQGAPVIALEGVTDRTQAEPLRGQSLLVPAETLPALPDDQVYLYELIGFSVLLETTGQRIGILDHVLFYGAQETWSVLTESGAEFLLPAVPQFIASIDTTARVIRVTPPDGLLELYGVRLA